MCQTLQIWVYAFFVYLRKNVSMLRGHLLCSDMLIWWFFLITTFTVQTNYNISPYYTECDSVVLTPEPYTEGSELFTITDNTGLLTLATSLDYEVIDRYVIIMEVVDSGISPAITGQIVVRV